MEKETRQYVTGIGGIFFRAEDTDATREWYRKHLNMMPEDFGGVVFPFGGDDVGQGGYSLWAPFKSDTKYFPAEQSFMINLRVRDLDGLLAKLSAEGIEQVGDMEESEFGKFAWIVDLNGVKIELWEQTQPIPE